MASFNQEVVNFTQQFPQVRYLDLVFADLNAIPRGKRLPIEAAGKLAAGVYLPLSTNSLDIRGAVVEEAGLGLEVGEPDHLCYPVPGTLVPTFNPQVAQVMVTMMDKTASAPCQLQGRNILAHLVDQLHTLGRYPVVAMELEFYLVDKQRQPNGKLQPPVNPVRHTRETFCDIYRLDNLDDYGAFLDELNTAAAQQGLNTAGAVAEAAPGQFEINFNHQRDVIKACDQVVFTKRLIRQVAQKHGFDATFMAKPFADQVGSGKHIHMSVLDRDGNNLFAAADGTDSAFFYQTLAAMLAMMPASMALLAPNVNAYRRFSAGMLAPVRADWGRDHRSVALRIPNSDSRNRRIEHRLAGADVNPYLLASVVLSALLHADQFSAEQCPPEQAAQAAGLPVRMSDALTALEHSEAFPQFLGQAFLSLFMACKQSELAEFEKAITSLEVDWMLHTA